MDNTGTKLPPVSVAQALGIKVIYDGANAHRAVLAFTMFMKAEYIFDDFCFFRVDC
ncbi:MAG: hypothetical protein HOJ91_10780 [Rhodospirillaceae bacterium]|nr:hypothetical protein [Rhodospirillaceae bacterium]